MRMVRTAVAKRGDAKKLADALAESGFAKCASFWRMESVYVWKGKMVREAEYALEAKCASKESAAKAAALAERLHPYEVPMVAILRVESANDAYLRWLSAKEGKFGKKKRKRRG